MEGAEGIARVELDRNNTVEVDAMGRANIPVVVHALAPGKIQLRVRGDVHAGERTSLSMSRTSNLEVLAIEPPQREVAVYGKHHGSKPFAINFLPPQSAHATRVRIDLDSSLVGDLAQSAAWLVSYPYRCLEQTASVLAPLALSPKTIHRLFGSDAAANDYLRDNLLELERHAGSTGYTYWPGDGSGDRRRAGRGTRHGRRHQTGLVAARMTRHSF